MNTLTLIVVALVAYLFFLTGSSFMFLLTAGVLVLLVSMGSGGGHDGRHQASTHSGGFSEKKQDNAAMDTFAGRLGDMVNIFGTLFGKFFTWAFKGEKKADKKPEFEPEFKITSGGGTSIIYKKK